MERQRGGFPRYPVRRAAGGQVPLLAAGQPRSLERYTARYIPGAGLPPATTQLNQQVT